MLWYLRANPPIRWLAWLLMFARADPFRRESDQSEPRRPSARRRQARASRTECSRSPVIRDSSHSALFGLAHMLMNGWVGDVIFFATFPALGILGGIHQDSRKIRELGETYREFKAKTSFMPFAALISGRQRWTSADTPWAAIGAGTVLTSRNRSAASNNLRRPPARLNDVILVESVRSYPLSLVQGEGEGERSTHSKCQFFCINAQARGDGSLNTRAAFAITRAPSAPHRRHEDSRQPRASAAQMQVRCACRDTAPAPDKARRSRPSGGRREQSTPLRESTRDF